MLWILRWPIVLILLCLAAGSLFPAVVVTVERADLPVNLAVVSPQLTALGEGASWLEAGLWYAAGLLFLISAVRLIRRTQGFWMWLLGFALYGGRWAVTMQDQGGLVQAAQSLSVQSFMPDQLTPVSPAVQTILLAGHLLVGLIIFAIDAADRRYWDSQAA
jgi:hypothetical protein